MDEGDEISLQAALRSRLTGDGLCAAETRGNKGGCCPSLSSAKTYAYRTAYLEDRSIAALPREHGVSRNANRTAVACLVPVPASAAPEGIPALESPVPLNMPGRVAVFLRDRWATISAT
ncbi:hypothetical protein AB0B50_44375 [Streptomyces sp. NPDC041068]|uniref:hypothetical protein n=1 Tax=Streptomyces sp. NPDC041068 TaxID=3155130 RepID=UPI0033FFA4F5